MKFITYEERVRIKKLLEQGYNISQIAIYTNRQRQTIYNELKRGNVNGVYTPEVAQKKLDKNIRKRNDLISASITTISPEVAKKIALHIKSGKTVSETAIALQRQGQLFSAGTIYSAIDKGAIPGIDREYLSTRRSQKKSKFYF